MTTSLVSALLHYLAPEAVQDQLNHGLLHNIAQFAHAAAQGKVGSGFDVSSAVYGTHQYSRFAPACLQDLLDCPLTEVNTVGRNILTLLTHCQIPSKRLVKVLSPSHNSSWSDPAMAAEVHPLALPPLTTMLLADVDAGSNTPSMVSAVLKWRKANPDSGPS